MPRPLSPFSASGLGLLTERCSEVGLSDDQHASLSRAGIDTLSRLRFGCSNHPGTSDDSSFITMVEEALGEDINLVDIAAVYELLFEACTTAASDISSRRNKPKYR
eukprot:882624-Amphidinium_carterae.1